MQILIAILALSFLIIIHELGHFTVAKLSNVKVHEFSLFMGPKLLSFQRGETMYSFRAVPLGGYVRMEGEEQASEDERAFNKKPIWIRSLVIAAGPLANILLALIIIFCINLGTGYDTSKVAICDPGSPAYDSGLRKGDEIIKYNGHRIFNSTDVSLFLYGTKAEAADIVVKRNGQTIPMTLKPDIIPADTLKLGIYPKEVYGKDSNIINDIEPNSPADKAGMKKGDRIVKMGDQTVANFREIRNYLINSKGGFITITVQRGSAIIPLSVKPIKNGLPEQQDVGMAFDAEKGGVIPSFTHSVTYSISIARTVYYSIIWLVERKVPLNQVSGPVGIVSFIGTAVKSGPTIGESLLRLLSVAAFLSINVGLFNLIPFPALDGSKLLILGVEKIRRKALPPEREAFISMIGFVLLIALMIFATYNDILRLIGIG
ncbi:MAG TPA: RIP metalloprotease RseP [Clostridia bacterium]|nr:RIP metalloprotease RseP [Clostridia bacterium]